MRRDNEQKLGKAISAYYKLDVEFKNQKFMYESKKKNLTDIIVRNLEEMKIKKITVGNDKTVAGRVKLACQMIKRTKIIYNVSKIKKKFNKKDCARILDKHYEIVDIEKLISLLKNAGVDPKEFKKTIKVTETINEKNLDKLEELGFITLDDLKGCYEIEEGNPYLKVSVDK